jgi:hypothetical protein
MGGMEGIEYGLAEYQWNHNSLAHEDYAIHDTEAGCITVKGAQFCG